MSREVLSMLNPIPFWFLTQQLISSVISDEMKPPVPFCWYLRCVVTILRCILYPPMSTALSIAKLLVVFVTELVHTNKRCSYVVYFGLQEVPIWQTSQKAFFSDHPEETAETFLSNRLQRTLRHRQCHRCPLSRLLRFSEISVTVGVMSYAGASPWSLCGRVIQMESVVALNHLTDKKQRSTTKGLLAISKNSGGSNKAAAHEEEGNTPPFPKRV